MTNREIEPIRSIEVIDNIKLQLMKQSYRNYIMFTIGINTGMRLREIIQLQVKDINIENGLIIGIRGDNISVSDELLNELELYISNLDRNSYLIESRQGENKPISSVRAYSILSQVSDELGIPTITSETIRKTYGYHHYRANEDIELLQNRLGIKDANRLIEYIGIKEDIEVEQIDRDISIKKE